MAGKPHVSVIIPTYNRARSLKATLDSLARQSYPADNFEVIVVDDGSTDETDEITQREASFSFRYLKQKNQGAASARNNGASEALGSILLFLDDDIHVLYHFVSNIIKAHRKFERVVTMGVLHPIIHEGATLFEKLIVQDIFQSGSLDESSFSPLEFTDCLTGIFAVKKSHYSEIGGMHDLAKDGRVAWGDVDFGYRARRKGFRFIRCNKAIGYHDDFSIRSLQTHLNRWARASQAAVRLFQEYPEIQGHLPMFSDKTPVTWKKDSPRLIARKLSRKAASSPPSLWAMQHLVRLLEAHYPAPILLRPLYRWVIGAHIYRGYHQGLRQYGPVPRSEKDHPIQHPHHHL